MPRRRPESEEPGDQILGDPTEQFELYEEIDRLRAETGPGGARRVIVFKQREDGKPADRCREFTSEQLDRLDQIPELFGGGVYFLQLMDQQNRYLKRFRVSWPPELYPQPVRPAPAPVGATPIAAPADRFTELITLMQQQEQKATERYIGLVQSLIGALSAGRIPAATSVKDRVEELVALRGLLNENPKAPVELLKEVLVTGLQLGRGQMPDGDDMDGRAGDTMKLIDKGLDVVNKVIDRRGQAAGTRAAAPAPTPAQIPAHLQPYSWLLRYVPEAIRWAQSGTSGKRVAGALYQLVPEDHLDALESVARMEQGERHQLFAQLDARLNPYQTFLDDVAQHLVALFDQEETDDDAGNGAPAAESA